MHTDLRDAWRHLAGHPGRTLALIATMSAALTLTVMEGAFGYQVAWGSLPFEAAERLVVITRVDRDGSSIGLSLRDHDVFARSEVFDETAAFNDFDATIFAGSTSLRSPGAYATSSLARILGARPIAGRWFSGEEDRPGGSPVAVIGERLAAELFGLAPKALGATVRIQDQLYTVVGVMERGFGFPVDAQFWIPVRRMPDYGRIQNFDLTGIARLSDGVTTHRASAALASTKAQLDVAPGGALPVLSLTSLRTLMIDPRVQILVMPLALVSILMLALAGVVVMNSFVVGVAERDTSLRVRQVLAGGRGAARRLILVEAGILASLATLTSAITSSFLAPVLAGLVPLRLPAFIDFVPRPSVIATAAVVCASVVLLSGLVALRFVPSDMTALRARHGTILRESARTLRGLAVAQLAVAISLGAAGVWAARTYSSFSRLDPGMRRDVTLISYSLSADRRYDDRGERERFLQNAVRLIQNMPGVTNVGLASRRPIDMVQDRGFVAELGQRSHAVSLVSITPGYLEAIGVDVIAGRSGVWADRRLGGAVIVSRLAARRIWGDLTWRPGRTLAISPRAETLESAQALAVIGMTEDAALAGLEEPSLPAVYVVADTGRFVPWVGNMAITSTRPSDDVVRGVRELMQTIDPTVPVYRVTTGGKLIDGSLWRSRLAAWLLASLGFVALVIAAVGVYSMTAAFVSVRQRELGIRSALGATRIDLGGNVLRATAMVFAGGIAAAVPILITLATVLPQSIPNSPGMLLPGLVACAVLGLVTVVACAGPARRAANANPAVLLKE